MRWHEVARGRSGAQELAHVRRSDDLALLGEGFVVLLDVVEVVAVVHHQAVRLPQALGRRVAEKVEPLQAGAVAEMEARHRVERAPARRLAFRK